MYYDFEYRIMKLHDDDVFVLPEVAYWIGEKARAFVHEEKWKINTSEIIKAKLILEYLLNTASIPKLLSMIIGGCNSQLSDSLLKIARWN